MNFQEVMVSTTLSNVKEISREELALFSLLIENVKTRSIDHQDAQLIYDIVDDKEIVALLENGEARDIDCIAWDALLGCHVDVAYLEKQTTIPHFVALVLRHMNNEGMNE